MKKWNYDADVQINMTNPCGDYVKAETEAEAKAAVDDIIQDCVDSMVCAADAYIVHQNVSLWEEEDR